MNKELDNILYKVKSHYTPKDYFLLNKIINKRLFICLKASAVAWLLITFNTFYSDVISIIFNIVVAIILWNLPLILVYRSYKSANEYTNLSFYENYFKVESINGENYRVRTTYYKKIKIIYIDKSYIIVKSINPINYTIIKTDNIIVGCRNDITVFLKDMEKIN